MNKLILDKELRAKLNGLSSEIEFCDESGKTLGHFLPDDVYKKLLYAWLKSQHSDEELDKARRETGGRPLKEIWKDLGRQ